MIDINADIDRAETRINQGVQKNIIALVSKSQQSSAANGYGPRDVIFSSALKLKTQEREEKYSKTNLWRRWNSAHNAGLYCEVVQLCSGGRWLFSPSEPLGILERAWKAVRNEGAWGGGGLAVRIYSLEKRITSPPAYSLSFFSIFLVVCNSLRRLSRS